MEANKEKFGKYLPDDFKASSLEDYTQKHIFEVFDTIEANKFSDEADFIEYLFRKENWKDEDYLRIQIKDIALAIAEVRQCESEDKDIDIIMSAKTGQPITVTGYAVLDSDGRDTGRRTMRRK